jgi:site-specific DNA-methyltransferase (adenine-specific)/site-specific DNA-methyltransferase (cytosine-N4-specific)
MAISDSPDQEIQLLQGDCREQIPRLADDTIQAVITSPPYAEQRSKKQHGENAYPGVPEKDYPAWMVSVFNALIPKLREDGSVLLNIRAHVENGAVSDYVLKTRLALREAKWLESEELIWYKPEVMPQGSTRNPRRTWEHILWFSRSKKPFVNAKAAGSISKNIGCTSTKKSKKYSEFHRGSTTKRNLGIARIEDVFVVPVSGNSKNVDHPAIFPPALVEQLIRTFSEVGDVILDPFAGSGTTLFVARFLKRDSIGIELDPKSYKLIVAREKQIDWTAIPPEPNLEGVLQFVKYAARMGQAIHLDFWNTILVEKRRWGVLDGVKNGAKVKKPLTAEEELITARRKMELGRRRLIKTLGGTLPA